MLFAEAVAQAPWWIATLLWLIPLPPIVAFGLISLFTNKSRSATTAVAIGGMLLSWIMSFAVFVNVFQDKQLGKHPIGSQFPWLATGDTTLNIGVVVDPLSATFLFMVPLAATLIFIYSTSYMAHETRYTRFFAYLSLFAGSMMGLVVSDNLLTLFVFWELMGFCSYSLIGFFYFKESAYKAAVKAFMTTRIGDMLLILGMVYLYAMTGTLNFHDILSNKEVLAKLAETPAILGFGAGFGAEAAHGAAEAAHSAADTAHGAASAAAGLGLSAAGLIGLLIFGGTVGKSAQFPLHVWLPDAMEGPTPVSAMIHAATMVSAGIFMTLRFYPLFQAAAGMLAPSEGGHHGPSTALLVVGLIGAITAFLGATIAIAQFDIKRVMAFSTISQLGFMVAAIGIGAYIAAAFHLLTHAFFKALLFLGSGSVIHGVEHGHAHVTGHHHHGDPAKVYAKPVPGADAHGGHGHDAHGADAHDAHGHDDHDAHGHDDHAFDPQDIRNMGGLAKRMPITAVTYLVGCAALAGFPFITAGFWSKDEIFADAWKHGFVDGDWLGQLVFVVLVASALLTAFYSTRQWFMVFGGKPRTEAAEHASENPAAMTVPLIVLSIFALFIGFINIPSDFPFFGALMGSGAYWLKDFLKGSLVMKPETLSFNPIPVIFSLGVAGVGILVGWLIYGANPLKAGQVDPIEKALGAGLHGFLARRWMFDELYRAIFIAPMQWVADTYSKLVDKTFIDGLVEGVYAFGTDLAGGFKKFDKTFITGLSDWFGRTFRNFGSFARELQTGQIQNYLISGLAMIALIVAAFILIY
jgi:NADH-quinone oxidoreductase subunit L